MIFDFIIEIISVTQQHLQFTSSESLFEPLSDEPPAPRLAVRDIHLMGYIVNIKNSQWYLFFIFISFFISLLLYIIILVSFAYDIAIFRKKHCFRFWLSGSSFNAIAITESGLSQSSSSLGFRRILKDRIVELRVRRSW